jgi:acetyl esterase/lipase
MPIGYLVTTLLVAWCTAFALAPPRPRRSSPSNLAYWFGFLVNELPFVAFYWLLASTLLALGQGDIASLLGWVGLAVGVLATCGLAVVVRRALLAGPTVDRALDTIGVRRPRRRPPYARILFAPYLMRRRDVERVRNIRYGDAGKWNLLDVYRQRTRPDGAPVFLHLHGGAFRSGRKSREARPLLYHLASRGWLCVSANYRLSPSVRFPDHLIDAKKVIAWVREHGVTYGADPTVVVVAGSSAGGNLAATSALTPNDPRFQPGFEDVDTSVTAAVSLYGYYGPYGDPASSPLELVSGDAPPFFVAHGDLDTIVLVEDARRFVERLRHASPNPVVYAELPGAQHTFDLFHSLRFEAVVDGIEAFVDWSRAPMA